MNRLSLLTLVFAVVFGVFLLLLVLFRTPVPPYPLMSYQDGIDLLTPLALIPLYWLLFRESAAGKSILREELAFMVIASTWVMGHGMHLAANSISNLIGSLAGGIGPGASGEVLELTHFYDEVLSHYLFHIGIIGMSVLLSFREWRRPTGWATVWYLVFPAGLIYGFTYFCEYMEGQSVVLGLPFAVVFVAVTVIFLRNGLSHRPSLAFFFTGHAVAVVLFAIWGLYWGGFPQFTDVGLDWRMPSLV